MTFVPPIADIGAIALLLLYVWMLSAIAASVLSRWKGYGEKPGLGTGLILSVIGVLIWLVWPSKPESRWREFFSRNKDAQPSADDSAESSSA